MQKKCIKCKIIRDVQYFPKDSSRSDGYYHSCRECNKKRLKHYFQSPLGKAALERYLLKRARAKRKALRMAWQTK